MAVFSMNLSELMSSLPQEDSLWQSSLAWQPTAVQWSSFEQLYQFVLAGNRRLNLTRITEPLDFLEKHLWDSLAGIFLFDSLVSLPVAQVIDIGTGGGFPGLPTAIAFPQWSITLLDSTQKKIAWLQEIVPQLFPDQALDQTLDQTMGQSRGQIIPMVGRAESLGQDPQHRAHYDLALIRAVADARVCAEYALPLLKKGGYAVLYRGQWTTEETEQLEPVVAKLGGTLLDSKPVQTPWSQSQRTFIYLQKIRSTPAPYPRAIGIPQKTPLAF